MRRRLTTLMMSGICIHKICGAVVLIKMESSECVHEEGSSMLYYVQK